MSYILDSLKKSEQERQQQSMVSPLEQVYDPSLLEQERQLSSGVSKRTTRWLIIGIVIVLFSVLAWWQLNRVQPKSTIDVTHVVSNEKPLTNHVPAPIPTPVVKPRPVEQPIAVIDKTPISSPVATDNTEEIDKLYQQLAKAKMAPPPAVKPKATKKLKAIAAQKKQVAPSIKNQVAAVTPSVQVQESKPSIPFFNDLSSLTKDKVPTISYSAHVFAENNNNGFVVINRKKSRVGTRLTNGIFIEKIGEDNVVLSYNGVVFKMPAMTSWINN